MTARRILLVAVLAIAIAVSGCGSTDDPNDARRSITVVLDWTPNTNHSGVYLAKRDGLYDRAGLDVSIVEPDQAGGVAQLLAGNATFAFSYAEQVLPAREQGTPVVSIATVLTTNTSSLVSPASRGITRPRDLAGRTYGTFGGAIEEPLVKALVRCDGGDADSVKFVDVGNADYNVGFRKRAYDAVWVFDGWDVIRLRDIAQTPVTTIPFRDHLDCIPNWYTPVLVATETTITQDPSLVKAFLAATAKGYQAAAANPADAAAALIDAVPEADRDLVAASARFLSPFYLDAAGNWGHQDPTVWERFDAFLRRSGILTKPAAIGSAFTNADLPPPQ